MHAAFRKSGALRKAPDALLPMFTNRVENANTFGPQSHRVGPCSEGWLKSWRKSALQSTRSTTGCPALGEYSMLGFKAFDPAQATLVGIELMHMIKKRQLVVEEGNEGRTAAEQFYALAA